MDGSGTPPFAADVRIQQGRILEVGTLQPQPQEEVYWVRGKVVAPGFVDLHNHSARGLPEEPEAVSQVAQGITTLVLGPDGSSPFPPGAYLKRLEETGSAVNVALLVGHGTLRNLVMGEDFRRPATPAELEAMAALLRLAMEQGAFGLSSGLEYDPGFYSTTEELIFLVRQIAPYGGLYMSHIRDEEEGFLEALAEAVEIGRQTGVRVQISHLKLGNRRVWGRTSEALALLQGAQKEGIDVQADCYPYDAWASSLSVLVPSRRFDDPAEVMEALDKVGGAQNVLITRYSPHPSWEFKTLEQISREQERPAVELFMEMIREGGAQIVCRSMSPEDVARFYADPLVMVASDGGIDSRHPRKAGTFPRVLARFVREGQLLSLPEAIRKMTSQPAGRLGLTDRGRVQKGYWADLVVFDSEEVRDRSDFQNPDLLPQGIHLTLVNGIPVWRGGKATGHRPGHLLRSP